MISLSIVARDRHGAEQWRVMGSIDLRRDLVQAVDSAIGRAGFSARARRQLDLARIWRQGARGRFVIQATETAGPVVKLDLSLT